MCHIYLEHYYNFCKQEMPLWVPNYIVEIIHIKSHRISQTFDLLLEFLYPNFSNYSSLILISVNILVNQLSHLHFLVLFSWLNAQKKWLQRYCANNNTYLK